jgi:flavin-dependent dehydrogenase
VNIGICIEGQDANGQKTTRNVRSVFSDFLARHYGARLRHATQLGAFKGHPIVYTTWIGHLTAKGALYLGEAARITHNATGEGISQAMQSGIYAADAVARILNAGASEEEAFREYLWKHRKRFTLGFVVGHAVRALVRSPVLDVVAELYGRPSVRRAVVRTLGSALAGTAVKDAEVSPRANGRGAEATPAAPP